jgi:type III restriction enzyme
VKDATRLVIQQTIDIPCITVLPKGEFSSGFKPFKLDTTAIHYQPVERDILIQHLRTHEQETLSSQKNGQDAASLESLIVQAITAFPDICYDKHADLLYDLSGQMIAHLRGYLKSEDDVVNVVQYFQRQLGDFIHAQMQEHFWEKADDYEVVISKGFSALKNEAFSVAENAQVYDCHNPLADKSKVKQMVFGGYKRCLYSVQKFDSDSERILALILDRNALKWFRPCHGQFQLYYKINNQQFEYQPDFVAETDNAIYMLEPKARRDMEDSDVVAKKEAAVQWCLRASEHNSLHGGKAWSYLLIPHDAIAENKTLQGFVAEFTCQ